MLVQIHSTSIRPLTTAHLAQTMSLLELTAEELRQKIEGELAAKPRLGAGRFTALPDVPPFAGLRRTLPGLLADANRDC